MQDLLENLNKEQKEAVTHKKGPLLIIAGAGTGKTQVITRRIAWLIKEKLAKPEEILALTFTDKAASEMEERVDILLPYGYLDLWILTFHSFGAKILQEEAFHLGIDPDFKILTPTEQIIFIKEHLFEFDLDLLKPQTNPTKFISSLVEFISRIKDEDIDPAEFERKIEKKEKDKKRLQVLKEIGKFYKKYEKLKLEEGYLDFGDLVILPLRLFRKRSDILSKYQKQFKFILIDEFQDTNWAQNELAKLLAKAHQNITVVGDDDQSIFKWRGASISNILDFKKTYPNAKIISLRENFRSKDEILDAAYRLIQHNNPFRLEIQENISKRLKGRGKGGKVIHLHFDKGLAEADKVAQIIKEEYQKGVSLNDIAILCRAHAHAKPFMNALAYLNIPFRFVGQESFFNFPEIKLLINFLKTITDVLDSISLYFLASSEIYNLDPLDLTLITNWAKNKNKPLFLVFKKLTENSLEVKELIKTLKEKQTISKIKKLTEDIEKFIKLKNKLPVPQLIYQFLDQSGYLKNLVRNPTSSSERKIKNISKFFEKARNLSEKLEDSLAQNFINYLELLKDDEPDLIDLEQEAVNILTLHAAKGLEFEIVFLVNLVEGRFPQRKKGELLPVPEYLIKEKIPQGDWRLQEERRLFYVGLTRAKTAVYLTSAKDYGLKRPFKISQFILEAKNLSPDYINSLDKKETEEKLDRLEKLSRSELFSEQITLFEKKIPSVPAHLSFRQIDDYLTCPLKYKYLHVLKIPVLAHHAVSFGSCLHKVVAEYLKRKKEDKDLTLKELYQLLEKHWISEGYLSLDQEDQAKKNARRILKRFYNKTRNEKPTLVEKDFKFKLTYKGRIIPVKGRWDRVDIKEKEVEIIDYKTGQVRDKEKAIERVKNSIQMKIYAFAWKSLYQQIPKTTLYFLESDLKGTWIFSEKDFQKLKEQIFYVIEGLEKKDFRPKPAYQACEYCAYQSICELNEN